MKQLIIALLLLWTVSSFAQIELYNADASFIGENCWSGLGFLQARIVKSLDGDPYDDIVIAASKNNYSTPEYLGISPLNPNQYTPGKGGCIGSDRGCVYIIWGRPKTDIVWWQQAKNRDIREIADIVLVNTLEGGLFGRSITCGDIDNDGMGDLILSYEYGRTTELLPLDQVGGTFILFGRSRADWISLQSIQPININYPDLTFYQTSLAVCQCIFKDKDFNTQQPLTDQQKKIKDIAKIYDVWYCGEYEKEYFGKGLGLADYDGDGLMDLCVGAMGWYPYYLSKFDIDSVGQAKHNNIPYNLLSRHQNGKVYIVNATTIINDRYSTQTTKQTNNKPLCITHDNRCALMLTGSQNYDQLGWTIEGFNDIDGDGKGDFAIGMQQSVGTWHPVYSKLHPDNRNVYVISSRLLNDQYALAQCNGRTFPEAANISSVYTIRLGTGSHPDVSPYKHYLGTTSTPYYLETGVPSTEALNVRGMSDTRLDHYGYSIANAGDINHDGIEDLLIANETYGREGRIIGTRNYQSAMRGNIYLVMGENMEWTPKLINLSSISWFENNPKVKEYLFYSDNGPTGEPSLPGRTMSGLGDINNDDKDDFIIGLAGDRAGHYSRSNSIIFWGGHIPDYGYINQDNSPIKYIFPKPWQRKVTTDQVEKSNYSYVFGELSGRHNKIYQWGNIDSGSSASLVSGKGDIDGDGINDFIISDPWFSLLKTGKNEINKPLSFNETIWDKRIDDINRGKVYIVLGSNNILNTTSEKNLWIKDSESWYRKYYNGSTNDPVIYDEDYGTEPNNQTINYYNPHDIWIRNQDDGMTNTLDESPIYYPGPTINKPYIYVKIRNKGNTWSNPANLELYWTAAGTGARWPTHWDNYYQYSNILCGDKVNAHYNGTDPLQIMPAQIPPIPPGESCVIKVKWGDFPDPSSLYNTFYLKYKKWFPQIVPWDHHLELMARIVDSNHSLIENSSSFLYMKNNNAITIKNTSRVRYFFMSNESLVPVFVRNEKFPLANISLNFSVGKIMPQEIDPITEGIYKIIIPNKMYISWLEGGSVINGMEFSNIEIDTTILEGEAPRIDTSAIFAINNNVANLNNISIREEDAFLIGIYYQLNSWENIQDTGIAEFTISQTYNNEVESEGSKIILYQFEPPNPTIPIFEVSTNTITAITSFTAISGGVITPDGNSTVIDKGVCWSTNNSPTIADNKTIEGPGIDNYTSIITGLTVNTTYYVRAYVITNSSIVYGNTLSFTTLSSEP